VPWTYLLRDTTVNKEQIKCAFYEQELQLV